FELGISSSNYIQFGYWDSMKQGLLAGEKLYLDLKRLEMAYLSQNQREYELSKTVSLLLLDPLAFIMLKETGQCMVSLPEAYFDMDYPGHYMRRIKSASLTIPCVAGPYTSVNCTLTLTQSKIRASAAGATPYVEQPVGSDPRFFYSYSATQSVATSTAQNDSGMFEVNFRDERYLPFEGAGVISQWLLSMPPDCNAFDVETITDVLFNLKFTARDGGAPLRDAARAAAVLPLGFSQGGLGGPPAGFPAKQPNLVRYFSLRHEFPTEWYQFFNPTIASATQPMTMPLSLTLDRFPFRFRGRKLAISQCELFLRLRDEYPPSLNSSSTPLSDFGSSALGVALAPPSTSSTSQTPTPWKSNAAVLGGIPYASIAYAGAPLAVPALNSANAASPAPPSAWTLTVSGISSLSPNLIVTINGTDTSGPTPVAVTAALLNPAAIADIFLVCHYSAS
ncbi:MAG TPA: hypothetical protein VGY99_33150, partial [Candidatus Binataceae bacterium]|nr:hypothetical protein [Candidatus Binataceae bacterium]